MAFIIDSLSTLTETLTQLKRGRTVLVQISSPPGTHDWYAAVSAVDPGRSTVTGAGHGELISDAITAAVEDMIARGG